MTIFTELFPQKSFPMLDIFFLLLVRLFDLQTSFMDIFFLLLIRLFELKTSYTYVWFKKLKNKKLPHFRNRQDVSFHMAYVDTS